MTLHLSTEQARNFLTAYHFRQTDLPGVFARLGTVQYDPLNPVGRNPDLVLQARVPGYQVDDWQRAAYIDREIYDSWDKQACLVPIGDWPLRTHLRALYRPYHDKEILETEGEAARKVLATIEAQGPMSSLEFEDQVRYVDDKSWAGQTRVKRILRSMWVCGIVVTHHRKSGRHYYDLPERVIPALHYQAAAHVDEEAYHRWIITRRYQAVGLLRSNAEAAIWSACGPTPTRKRILAQLVEDGTLTPVRIGDKSWDYYILSSALPLLDTTPSPARMTFLGPLDNILWDRKAVQHIFNFDYTWEVYKPAAQRRWGYYVLPVFYGNRFVARLDSRLENGVWTITRWWWEDNVHPDTAMLDALHSATADFLHYLRASAIRLDADIDTRTQAAIRK